MQRAIILIEAAETLAERYAGDEHMDFAIGTLLREAASLLLCLSKQRTASGERATAKRMTAANDVAPPPISDLGC